LFHVNAFLSVLALSAHHLTLATSISSLKAFLFDRSITDGINSSVTTTDYLPGSVDGSLISRSWFVVQFLSPTAVSLLCAISSLHHHSGHELPEFGLLFAIDLLRASSACCRSRPMHLTS
jgi:hypothetical protein